MRNEYGSEAAKVCSGRNEEQLQHGQSEKKRGERREVCPSLGDEGKEG